MAALLVYVQQFPYKNRIRCKVYDKNTEPTVAGAGIIIAPNAMQALELYGISKKIKKFGNESDGFNLVSKKVLLSIS